VAAPGFSWLITPARLFSKIEIVAQMWREQDLEWLGIADRERVAVISYCHRTGQ
jgi:hypothetical protein